jgi:hypothetical protein
MRTEEVFDHNKSLKVDDLNSTGIERARLNVLMDISETLAMLTDLYGAVHGREIISKQQQQQMQAQQNQQQFTGPRPMPPQVVSQEEDPPRQSNPDGNG